MCTCVCGRLVCVHVCVGRLVCVHVCVRTCVCGRLVHVYLLMLCTDLVIMLQHSSVYTRITKQLYGCCQTER